ncbi:adenosylcobinamide-phosphate synthase [Natranaerovirga hydrolytica]|uniref:Cobalamin biosynthesis protein CobD n=1 Tax=Natranaerovirga hydrolytica TaxID=680378 RepID=A0A4R1N115_9FIRM|nr:adenosylcobinamide-phosphate synthase CbiB [Natranaerovirga hydrolytica]TCK98630.1 adenosylcobinamide-phosphate synthase [Natranaerovirga hydrolytica]
MNALLLLSSVLLDWILGDPPNWKHPIIYIGKLIQYQENNIRKHIKNLFAGGFLLAIGTILSVVAIIQCLLFLAQWVSPVLVQIITIYLMYTGLAAKCLSVEVKKVIKGLTQDIQTGRKSLSYLVGRDTSQLTEEEIIKGAIETTAENTIDGVIAPLFYIGIGFLIGMPVQCLYLYKTVNTLDSMVGYNVEPYREIGYASAKLDDILNYIPARIGSLVMVIATYCLKLDWKNSIRILIRDRRNHKSPNCAYPESVIAGALNIQLGGTHTYFDKVVEKPTIGDQKTNPNASMIHHTIKVMYLSEGISVMLLTLFLII